MQRYYVYTHFRLDRNEIFYVGIGTRTKTDFKYNKYTRAFSRYKRSKFWKHIVEINPDYRVNIVFESNSRSEIIEKEIELIKEYGRRDLRTGTLCNLTDGGEGANGFIFSNELLEKWSRLAKERAKFGSENHSSKKIYQYSLNGDFVREWLCIEDCNREFGFQSAHIISCTKGRCKTAYGFQWFKDFQGEKVKSVTKGKNKQDGYLEIKDTRYKRKKYESS